MKKYLVEVWERDENGNRTKLFEAAPPFVQAKSAQDARDIVVQKLGDVDLGMVQIVICQPLPLATA